MRRNLLWYRRRTRSTTIPIVANQSLPFGRKTPIGWGASGFSDGTLVSTGGTPTSLTLGTRTVGSDHFEVDSSDLKPTVIPADVQYVWTGCVASNAAGDSAPFTLTIDTEANARSIRTWAQLASGINAAGIAYGDIFRLRNDAYTPGGVRIRRTSGPFTGTYTEPSYKTLAHQGRDLTTGNPVVITKHAGANVQILNSTLIDFTDETTGVKHLKGLRLTDLDFYFPDNGAMTNAGFVLSSTNGTTHLILDNNTFAGPSDFVNDLDEKLWSGVNADKATNVTIQDNEISWVAVGIITGSGDNFTGVGNIIRGRFEDGVKVGGGSDWKWNWNQIYNCDGLDLTAPIHGDMAQWVGPSVSVDDIEFIGNVHIIGRDASYVGVAQGNFMDNMATAARFTNLKNFGNFSSTDHVRATTFQQTDGAKVFANTAVNDLENLRSQTAIMLENQDGGAADSTDCEVTENVSHAVSISEMTGALNSNNNTDLDHTDDSSYTSLFDDPVGGADLTIANFEAKFLPKASGALDVDDHEPIIGCIPPSGRTAEIDFDARTYDFPQLEGGHTPALSGINASEQVTGVSATGALITMSGGGSGMTWELRDTDDSTVIETGIVAGDRRIIYDDQYYETSGADAELTIDIGSENQVVSAYAAHAVHFDGTNDYLLKSSDFTGNADTKLITVSFWAKNTNATISALERIYMSAGYGLLLGILDSEKFFISAANASATDILGAVTSVLTPNVWNHFLFSCDLTDSGKRHLYLNGSSDYNHVTYTDDTMNNSVTSHSVGASPPGSQRWNGDIADLWMDPGRYVDFSVESNRLKFIDAAGKPVDLGSDGSTPFGAAPLLCLNNSATTGWETNKGSGGGMTEIGALTDASSSPSD